ncbi:hypothetical protein, partial [Priestia megaterium]|uniref:hypothetical protein n=1 Tax=Priestia megaterium TaxID=1404 RepID=UPI00300B600B
MLLSNAVQNNQELIKSLQDKVDKSGTLVKGMEQKVISIQKDQIDFLHDVITSLSWALGTVLTIIAIVAGVIAYTNQQAKKKMEDAERVIREAKEYIIKFSEEKIEIENSRKELEDYRKETQRFRE